VTTNNEMNFFYLKTCIEEILSKKNVLRNIFFQKQKVLRNIPSKKKYIKEHISWKRF